jgi:hypothetical protein
MKLGAEPKKVAILGALLLGALVIVYFNYFAGGSEPKPTARPVAAIASPPVVAAPVFIPPGRAAVGGRRRTSNNGIVSEFKLRQGVEPGAEKPDPATIDPTLRLDLLAKLQQVEMPTSMRNIFQYGAAPPPPAVVPVLPTGTKRIIVTDHPAPPPAPTGPPPPPPVPTAPQMTFKYYGYKVSKSDGRKQAFLLDGEDIIIAGENDSVKLGRYKVVRIGVSSITIEDTQFKSTQTLQLQPDAVA